MIVAEKKQYAYGDYEEVSLSKKSPKKYRKLKQLLSVFILFSFGIFLLFRYSFILEYNQTLNKMENDIKMLKSENQSLMVEIARNKDITYIDKIARNELGMKEPAKNQIVYMNSPHENVSTQSLAQNNNQGWNKIRNLINKILGLLY